MRYMLVRLPICLFSNSFSSVTVSQSKLNILPLVNNPKVTIRFASTTDLDSRILPQDFSRPTSEATILNLLTLTSLSIDVLRIPATGTPKNLNKICSLSFIDDKERELPFYRLMTEEELNESREKAKLHLLKLMEMPPFLHMRPRFGDWIDEEKLEHLFPDSVGGRHGALESCVANRHVFVDISEKPSFHHHPHSMINIPIVDSELVLDSTLDKKRQCRSVVVREMDGRLREATGLERDRLLQVYFPKPGREQELPATLRGDSLDLAVQYFSLYSGNSL